MKIERSKVDFPLWRKKVDKSLFKHNGTAIPMWACEMWCIPRIFSKIKSKNDPNSKVKIKFNDSSHEGRVTETDKGRKKHGYRLWFDETLTIELKRNFLMSYMRSLEDGLDASDKKDPKKIDIEKKIPFWEFLDIEFDKNSRVFHFKCYYFQEPSFPNLFFRLIGSPSIEKIGDEVLGKKGSRIYKQDWKPRNDLEYAIGAKNVIYKLIDTNNKLFYVGEAADLVKRLLQNYPTIPNWDYFRYDVLPDELAPFRVMIERMVIRDFATLMSNNKDIKTISISDFKLTNEKIDK